MLIVLPSTLELILADRQLKTITTPTFTATAQEQLIEALSEADVQHLITMDYEAYGVIEALQPNMTVTHSWAAISHKKATALPDILSYATNKHLIVLEASQPMIYNLRPDSLKIRTQANSLGLDTDLVSTWPGAHLYSITNK
jgi:hypothetical protein